MKTTDKIYSYVNERCMVRNLVEGRALRFPVDGYGTERLASILGWLKGLEMAGYEHAEKLENDFLRSLGHLAEYGGDKEVEYLDRKFKIPSTIISLHDDGSMHGFSLAWYMYQATYENEAVAMREHVNKDKPRPFFDGNYPCHAYDYFMNGGLIYHGPKTAEQLRDWKYGDSYCWGVHT